MLRRNIKSVAKNKVDVDLDFCKHIFYSKSAYVTTKTGDVPFYLYCGYDTWQDYIEKEVNITTSKARKFASIYSKYFIELEGVFDAKKHAIDVVKLGLLLPIVDEDNLESLINTARDASQSTLKDLISPSKDSTKKTISYRIKKKENSIVNKAIKMARKEFGEDLTEGQLYIAILCEYMEKSDAGKQDQKKSA